MRYPISKAFYRRLLLLLPRHLRASHGNEMERLFEDTLDWETNRSGWKGYALVWLGATKDVLEAAWSERKPNLPDKYQRKKKSSPTDTSFQDIRYAVRSLRRSPGFTTIVILTIGLGIGANAAIFSIVHTVVLQPLPFPEPDRLLTVWETDLEHGVIQSPVSAPTFLDWRERNRVFRGLSVLSPSAVALTGGPQPERISSVVASPNIFDLLGVTFVEGNGFPPEAEEPGRHRLVVLSYRFWQRWFGEDPSAVGRSLTLDDEPFTVVGILTRSFRFPASADLWLPFAIGTEDLEEGMRGARYLQTVARLRPGVPIERAQEEMSSIAEALGEEHPINAGWGVRLERLHDTMVRDYRKSLLLLLSAVGFVLIIACANVANLVLARAADTQRDRAVRAALGATRLRLLRQSLTEHLLLSLGGGLLGVLGAVWAVGPMVRLAPAAIPRLDDVSLNGAVLAYCLILCVSIVVFLSFISNVSGSRLPSLSSLRAARSVSGGPAKHRLRRILTVAQVALSLLLLVGAGLMLRSFVFLQRVDPGFSTRNITTASLYLPPSRYDEPPKLTAFHQSITDRLGRLGRVETVGATTNLPLSGSTWKFGFRIEGRPETSFDQKLSAEFHAVSPDYFRAIGIALKAGRAFLPIDNQDSPPVVIINETMARRFWPDRDPIGQRVSVVSQTGPVSREIVGVVGDVRHGGLRVEPPAEVYVPLWQDPWPFVTLVLRTSGDQQITLPLLQAEVGALDPAIPLHTVNPIEQWVAKWLAPLRFQTTLIGLFALAALGLASLGIYGVIAYVVSLRTNEIGIRMALGARRADVFTTVVGQGMALTAIGVALGLLGAWALTQQIAGLLFEVSPTDPLTLAAISALVLIVGFTACFLPARRAMEVDPAVALRHE